MIKCVDVCVCSYRSVWKLAPRAEQLEAELERLSSSLDSPGRRAERGWGREPSRWSGCFLPMDGQVRGVGWERPNTKDHQNKHGPVIIY